MKQKVEFTQNYCKDHSQRQRHSRGRQQRMSEGEEFNGLLTGWVTDYWTDCRYEERAVGKQVGDW